MANPLLPRAGLAFVAIDPERRTCAGVASIDRAASRPQAQEALRCIRELYAIEDALRGQLKP
jgi:flagellar biosynthesis regulator FlbT